MMMPHTTNTESSLSTRFEATRGMNAAVKMSDRP